MPAVPILAGEGSVRARGPGVADPGPPQAGVPRPNRELVQGTVVGEAPANNKRASGCGRLRRPQIQPAETRWSQGRG